MAASSPRRRSPPASSPAASLLLLALAAGALAAPAAPGPPGAPAARGTPPTAATTSPAPPAAPTTTPVPPTAPAPSALGRDTVHQPSRPQEPVPPFPYLQREVGYDNGNVHLAGTLTLPEGRGPFPAVLLIRDGGARNRDEGLFGHKPFLVLADHLTRADVAVLRVDGRGIGGSTGDAAATTLADLAGDALAGVRFLAAQPEIGKDRIGLAGHGEGGAVAALAASRSREVAFVVMLAAPGVPGYDLLLDRAEATARAAGAPEPTVKQRVALERQALDAIRAETDAAALAGKLTPILRAAAELAAPPERTAAGDLDAAVRSQVKASTSPAFRDFLAFDPRPVLRQLGVPVLAVGLDKDVEVPAARNLGAIERTLQQGGGKDITIRRIPGLNHVFQHAKTGSPAEYAASEETFDPDLQGIITRWIVARFGGRPAAPAPTPAPPSPPR